jgi:hypothetical protein
MTKPVLTFLLFSITTLAAAQEVISIGVFTGITSTHTWDEGIFADARYRSRHDLKIAPIGIACGLDYKHFGLIVSPGLITTGQNYNVVNTVGTRVGIRKINLLYLNLPVALKLPVIDLSVLKISFIVGGSAAYRIKGNETIKHTRAKLKFAPVIYPILPADYVVDGDGVLVPEVNNYQMLKKKDFKPFQYFGFIGMRSDWKTKGKWRVSVDIRVLSSILENRSLDYLNRLQTFETLYDIAGNRRDITAQLSIGISRFIEIEKKKKDAKQRSKKLLKKTVRY